MPDFDQEMYDEIHSEEAVALENESDLDPLPLDLISKAVVHATDWTSETILSQIDKGNIMLNPKFQRRDAWRVNRKSAFIESLILGFPIPQIVLAEISDQKGKYIVLDGKQRLLSMKQFSAAEDDKLFSTLKLKGLKLLDSLIDKSLSDLINDSQFSEQVSAFENQTIRTVVIKNWPNEEFLFHVFLRLNTNSVGLSPQELRQALHPGPFIDYADEKSFESEGIKSLLKLKKPDFRMRDVELLIRFLSFKYFITSYRGSLKSFLDESCKSFNDEWDKYEPQVNEKINDLDEAYNTCASIFEPSNICRKWTGGKYESRFNRAIFDFLMYYFSEESVRNLVAGHEPQLRAKYEGLFENDQDFRDSIERTTKSMEATCVRFSKWAAVLNDELGANVTVPTLVDNRINI